MMLIRMGSLVLIGLSVFIAGCSEDGQSSTSQGTAASGDHDHGDGHAHEDGHDHGTASEDAHAHPTEGPHHGHLVELGNEEFHAELVHDQSSVTIYVLDSTAKNAVAIEAGDVVINLKRDGKPEQFKIPASAESTDPAGKASRFVLQSEDLVGLLEKSESEARLSLMINETPYSGSLAHDHSDHSDHKH